jgi:hypothetical protein
VNEHNRMDCTEIEAHLALFIGGDLEAPLAALVGFHLGACEACGQRLTAARSARSALLGLAELEGEARAVDLWPELRASLVAEGLCHPSAAQPTAPALGPALAPPLARGEAPAMDSAPSERREPLRNGRLLRFSRAFAGLAAAASVVLLWRPWVDGAIDPSSSAGSAPVSAMGAAPVAATGAAGAKPDLAGLVVPTSDSGVASADVLPVFLEGVPSRSGGLRRAGPEDELLRNLARPFSGDARRIQTMHSHGQEPWSLASDGELR